MFEGLLLPWQQIHHHASNSIFRTTPEVSSKFFFVEIVKSRRNCGFLITEKLIFWHRNFGIYFYFSASLNLLPLEHEDHHSVKYVNSSSQQN